MRSRICEGWGRHLDLALKARYDALREGDSIAKGGGNRGVGGVRRCEGEFYREE